MDIGDVFIISVLVLVIFGVPVALVIGYRILCHLYNVNPKWWIAVLLALAGVAFNYFVLWPGLRFPE